MSFNNEIPSQPGKRPAKKRSSGAGANSNVVKLGLAGVLLLLMLLIVGWELGWFSGGDTGPRRPPAPPPATVTPPPPPVTSTSPPPMPPATAPSTTTAAPETPPPTSPEGAPPGGGGAFAAPAAVSVGGSGQPGMPPASPYGENPALPPLPEDFTKWTKEEFQRARREGNPNLIPAVTNLGTQFKGDRDKAQELVEFLKTPKPPETRPGQPSPYNPGGYGTAQPELIKAIVYALGNNGSDLAEKTLLQIIKGTVPTDDDRSAIEAALTCLVSHPSPLYDNALLVILIEPEKVRSQNPQGVYPPAELRTKALELVKPLATEELREKLAQRMAATVIEPNQPLTEFLLQEDPLNLRAQLVLYKNEDLQADAKTRLEQYFLNYASLTMGLTLRIPSTAAGATPGGPGAPPTSYSSPAPSTSPPPYSVTPFGSPASPGRTPGYSAPGYSPPAYSPPAPGPATVALPKLSETEQAVRLAKQIWAGQLAASLASQLDNVKGLDKQTQQILLAAAIPTDPLRAAMFKMLKKRSLALDDPQPLETAGLADRIVTDPGFLVLAKLQPRKDRQGSTTGRAAAPGAYAPLPTYSGTPPGGKVDQKQKREQAEQDWYNLSLKLVNCWCSRLYAAAQAQKKAARKGETFGEPPPEKPDDLELPKDLKIEAAYQINWPEKASKDLIPANPGLLKVQYFRLEPEGQIKKIMALLRRGLRTSETHPLESGVWIDALKTESEHNAKRSLDIFITRTDKTAYDPTVRKEEDTGLEINILAVEINDPAGPKESPPPKPKEKPAGENEK